MMMHLCVKSFLGVVLGSAIAIGAGLLLFGLKKSHDTDVSSYADQITSASAIVEGASGAAVKSVLYVFMDPNCVYCHRTWMMLQPYEKIGLQVHWIPMSYLKKSSFGKSAALLDAQNGAATLSRLETHFDESTESADIAPELHVSPQTAGKLTRNLVNYRSIGLESIPLVIRSENGKLIASMGMPLLHELPTITGLPVQTNSIVELNQFE